MEMWEPVFDLHGPLVKDEHWTCGDDKQDRDKLKNQWWGEEKVSNTAFFKYQIPSSQLAHKMGSNFEEKYQIPTHNGEQTQEPKALKVATSKWYFKNRFMGFYFSLVLVGPG